MKTRVLLAGAAVALFGAGTVAVAHDADPLAAGTQAHQIGPYQVVDEVIHDVDNETTTASYTVTVPDGAKDLGHLSLRLADCSPQHKIEESPPGGQVERKGDPSTGTLGPVLKWTSDQESGETQTYYYRVKGLFEPEEGDLVLKSRGTFRGIVERISCDRLEPPPCTLTGPDMTQSSEGTLIEVLLECTFDGSDDVDFGFGTDSDGNPTPPLLDVHASAAGQEVARVTDKLLIAGADQSTTKFKQEVFVALPIDEVCVTVLGQEVCRRHP